MAGSGLLIHVGEKEPIAPLIAHLAERQHGHVTRRQLLGAGLGVDAIKYRLSTGELIRVHAGVYAVRYRRVGPVARACAAVLACGEQALLSHDSALALWHLRPFPRIPEVMVAGRRIRRPGIVTHRTTTLQRDDATSQLGIRTTTVARAIADTHRRLSDRRLVRLVNDARHADHLKPTALRQLLDRCPRLRELIDPSQNPSRSPLEDLLLPWIHEHRLPVPRIDHDLHGYEVDAYFETEDLIVELDGWEFHSGHGSFLTDRERDAHHLAHGTPTVRIPYERLDGREADRLRCTLQRRRAEN